MIPNFIITLRKLPYLQHSLQWLFIPMLLLGIAVALAHQGLPVEGIFMGDKILHASAFFGFTLLMDIAWQKSFWLWKFAPLVAYGAAIELLQGLTTWRSMSSGDLVADATGVVLYWLCAYQWLKPSLTTPD